MKIHRRKLLLSGLGVGGAAAFSAACTGDLADDGGGASDTTSTTTADGATTATSSNGPAGSGTTTGGTTTGGGGDPSVWVVTGTGFVEGSGATLDLTTTLPVGTPTGGTFGVDPGGAPLPAGMVLTADGFLSVGSAVAGSVDGVIFTYEFA